MNPMDILKNFQNMQSRVNELQEKMKNIVVRGTAGGDMVIIEMNGQMDVTRVTISPEVVNSEEVEMLQDLILAAFTDASSKVKEEMRKEMSSITGGLDIPPGLLGG
ncbi:MAG: YbaB/EbfC family nucleoid-associated protein [Spirochaetes bacterium]|nr:MAG: YbaB/EbfC family nucleoid-associated protein [Spirochaetota bacterium]